MNFFLNNQINVPPISYGSLEFEITTLQTALRNLKFRRAFEIYNSSNFTPLISQPLSYQQESISNL